MHASVYYLTDYTHFKSIVDELLVGGVDLTIAQPGPILYICLQYNKIDFAKYLLAVGADVKQRTLFGQSCFYKGRLKFFFDETFVSIYLLIFILMGSTGRGA